MYSFLKNFRFNVKIFTLLTISKTQVILKFKKSNNLINNLLFNQVILRNVKEAYDLYKDEYAVELLSKLIMRFKKTAKRRNHIPILIIFPQPQDLKLKSNSKYFNMFLYKIKNEIELIDLTGRIKYEQRKKYYLDDKYGGHFSKYGNIKVSEIILNFLKKKYGKILN